MNWINSGRSMVQHHRRLLQPQTDWPWFVQVHETNRVWRNAQQQSLGKSLYVNKLVWSPTNL
jgi:hypothetical protein